MISLNQNTGVELNSLVSLCFQLCNMDNMTIVCLRLGHTYHTISPVRGQADRQGVPSSRSRIEDRAEIKDLHKNVLKEAQICMFPEWQHQTTLTLKLNQFIVKMFLFYLCPQMKMFFLKHVIGVWFYYEILKKWMFHQQWSQSIWDHS